MKPNGEGRERLTRKQQQVLEAMAIGLYLRRKRFSSLWEIARTPSDTIVSPRFKIHRRFYRLARYRG